ncbi:type II toxin-antitoxin system RelE/ParE family toxin [Pelagibacterium sediminicola]|uniref:type II toxin-antitoxin system RelE/ParE family toxin n=1 Tax=Pelagibacterium sediminicola TaxID=2248761 RepID=UPI000E322F0C|nr:type II toxin-antitoxin system RelE/ParE family toxin [Pelagibacterium sediminicola]
MKVRLSTKASDYVRQEAAYLRQHSQGASQRFLMGVRAVKRDLARFPEAGFPDEALPIPGLRRLIRNGYRYDYRILEEEVQVAEISSSVNTPLLNPSDDEDFDFEDPPKDAFEP